MAYSQINTVYKKQKKTAIITKTKTEVKEKKKRREEKRKTGSARFELRTFCTPGVSLLLGHVEHWGDLENISFLKPFP